MGTNEDRTEDRATAVLVRDAMDRALAELPTTADLVGPARAQGLRRRARVRAAIGGAVLAVAGLGLAGAFVLPGDGDDRGATGSTGVVDVAGPPTSSAPPPPIHLEPSPGESSMADLPPAERARQENFQNQAVGVLQQLLPPSVGTVQRIDLSVRQYQGSKDGKTFRIIFSVRPSEPGMAPQTCREIKDTVCSKATLPGGIRADAAVSPINNGNVTESRVWFRYGASDVSLRVGPHDASNTSAPVTGQQLLDVAGSAAFLDLVKAADRDPVEEMQRTVIGG
ncbi:hypothetical protein DEJ51_14525 [Streptomyces venezuelae]|uniref:Uncharacterized protein n=1 Tax=Streptomyces venezuelae TaxID=54571 RepID=A0A5P2DPU3_STRVZ|nr:hypothetical protein [Streptomyces venezuelae]QES55251.1 hypothetical protein DEJ51_14525 [Streptomyces venezuelae]